jgi:hypothetical protein
MPKAAPTKNHHAFAAWVYAQFPNTVWIKIDYRRTYTRRNGFRSEEYTTRIALDHFGRKIDQTSDDLAALSRWILETARPYMLAVRNPIAPAVKPKPMPAKVAG